MAFPVSPADGQIHSNYIWNSTKAAWEAYTEIFPIGAFFVQYPDAASDTDSIAFPVDKRPASLYGGTWSEVFNTEGVFFRTGGDGGRVDITGGRSNGLQLDQMQRITGYYAADRFLRRGLENEIKEGALSGEENVTGEHPRAATGNQSGALIFNSADSPDARASANTAGENRPTNRLIKVWKRIA